MNKVVLPDILTTSCQWVKCRLLLNSFHSAKGDVLLLDTLVPCGVDSSGSPLFKSAQKILNDKHPLAQPAFVDSLLKPDGVKAPVSIV